MDKPVNLYEESFYLQGARMMFQRIREAYYISNGLRGKEEKVYVDAELDLIGRSVDDVREFLTGRKIAYRDWKRDKKGKLVKCEAYWWK